MSYRKMLQNRRADRQKNVFSKIKEAMSGVPSRTANMVFDLTNRNTHKIDANRTAKIKAMQLVSDLIGQFGIPMRSQLRDLGMVKDAVANDGTVRDGTINVGVTLQTLMGHKASIDIPVIIRDRSLVEPAVFFHDGAPYVMCGPAIEQLVRKGSLDKNLMPRGMYQPPASGESASMEMPRTPIVNRENQFSPGARNPWTFKKYHNKQAQIGWEEVESEPFEHVYEKEFSLDTPSEEYGLDSGVGHKVTVKQTSDWVSTFINDSIEFAGFRASGNSVEDERRAKKLFDDWLEEQNPEFEDLMMYEGQKKEPHKRVNSKEATKIELSDWYVRQDNDAPNNRVYSKDIKLDEPLEIYSNLLADFVTLEPGKYKLSVGYWPGRTVFGIIQTVEASMLTISDQPIDQIPPDIDTHEIIWEQVDPNTTEEDAFLLGAELLDRYIETATQTHKIAKDKAMSESIRKKEPRKRVNIDVDTVFPELWTSNIPDHVLDPAERSRDGLLSYGTKVKLTENAEVRERGGGHLVLPSGEQGVVMRDEDGSGCMVYVNFPAMNLTAMLPSKMFKKAGKASVDQVRNEVRQMMREGYQKVDIQEAISRRYPEQAQEALDSLE